MNSTVPELLVRDMQVKSRTGRQLLQVDALREAAGECLAVRGPSGAGKSTLLFALAGLIPVKDGSITWGGREIAGTSERKRAAFRRETCGIVFQDHLLFEELSAQDNAGLSALFAPKSAREEIDERGSTMLATLGVDASDRRRSESYSGGERQRIAVARALAGDPPVILADEPTASLDRANADRLIDDLFGQARAKGKTLIAVSHDPVLFEAADRVVTLQDGVLAGP